LLIERPGALNNNTDGWGTAMNCAAKLGELNCLLKTIELGADMTIPDKYGYLPIHNEIRTLVYDAQSKGLRALIDGGADVNAMSKPVNIFRG